MAGISACPFAAVLVIANPAAGRVDRRLVDEVTEICGRHGPRPWVRWTTGRGDAVRAAARAVTDGFDLVIAAGGDGTVGEVVHGLLSAGSGDELPALLIVPAGTGNSSYLAQWGRMPWQDALRATLRAADARRCLLDLALLVEQDTLVLLGAVPTLPADALAAASSVPAAGPLRYRIAMARVAAGYAPYPGRVLVDGRVIHSGPTVLANVGGGRHRGGSYELLPRSLLDDGLLDVCVIGGRIEPRAVLRLTPTGDYLDTPGVGYGRGGEITVERTDGAPLSFERDGELCTGEATSFTMRVLPGVLPVVCQRGTPAVVGSGRASG